MNGAAEGVGRPLGLAEARESPCATCATSPCCTHLPLHSFSVTTLTELDHAIYLLNFENILLGLSSSGEWSVYYQTPCRFLDVAAGSCTVHATPAQPQICVTYNPYHCWYRTALSGPTSADFLPIDHARMQFILRHVEFDESRVITSVPDWDSLQAAFAAMPSPVQLSRKASPAAGGAPVADVPGGISPVDTRGAAEAPVLRRRFIEVLDPCQGCAAPCCDTLVFPSVVPATAANLDYYRFCLGFPGVELGIADGGWSVIVKTTCRHLVGSRCSLFGLPERPLLCKYYDALKCTYRVQFADTPPEGFLRVRLEDYAAVLDCFDFDGDGTIIAGPTTAQMRERVSAAGPLSPPTR